jgi:phage terminase large subunit
MWAVDPMTLAVYLYREFFRTNTRPDLLGRWARQELERGEKRPQAVVCDHDDEPKREFERESGLHLQLADKADRDKGIQEMQARFDNDPQTGQPRIFFHPNALAHKPDPYLEERGIPSCTVAEILGYVWNEDFLKDEPIDINDHGCDSGRYLIRYVSTHMVAGGTPKVDYGNAPRRTTMGRRG